MANFYKQQFGNLHSEGNPLPKVRVIDSDGNATQWLHLTIECINELQTYLENEKQKRLKTEMSLVN